MLTHPLRSVLYIPASNPKALAKARSLPADALIFDLEDAVSPEAKSLAREALAEELGTCGYGGHLCLVRVNGMATDWGQADLDHVLPKGPDGLVLPKVNGPGELDAIREQTDLPIWAMIETAQGVLNATAIANAKGIAGFILGSNDLARELGARNRAALTMALQHSLLAARAAGIACIDGVYNAFRDTDGLRLECQEARDWGMDGKSLIHPAQIETANAIFAPSTEEIDLARRHIDAYEAARAKGMGIAVVDGAIVENLHADMARQLLARAEAIARRAAQG